MIMVIVNGTAHAINIIDINDCTMIRRKLIVNESAVALMTIPAGSNLNATKDNLPLPEHFSNSQLHSEVEFALPDMMPSPMVTSSSCRTYTVLR